jgi:acetyltransferase EpsM
VPTLDRDPVRSVVIWGASGHGRVVADIVRCAAKLDLVGFLDDAPHLHGTEFAGAPVLGGSEALAGLAATGVCRLIVAIGDCEARLRVAAAACGAGFGMPNAIHPSAVLAADTQLGAGTVVAAGAVVGPAARLGEQVIVNTGATVDHDCVIEDGVHVAVGAHLAGGCRVDRAATIGVGAVLVPGVRVGARALIGAGAVVVADVAPGVVAFGVPARAIRMVAEG